MKLEINATLDSAGEHGVAVNSTVAHDHKFGEKKVPEEKETALSSDDASSNLE